MLPRGLRRDQTVKIATGGEYRENAAVGNGAGLCVELHPLDQRPCTIDCL
jgi:hypothetical protein